MRSVSRSSSRRGKRGCRGRAIARLAALAVFAAFGALGSGSDAQQWAPGLWEGRVPGAFNLTDPNPNTAVQFSPRMGETNQKPPWGDNETWVYTGQIYDDDGVFSMAESIDDSVSIVIDGVLRLQDTNWSVPTSTGVLSLGMGPDGDGWHDIEIRLGNGGAGAGAVADKTGWTYDFGLGYSSVGTDSTRGDQYVIPLDDGTMNRLRHAVPEPASAALLGISAVGLLAYAWRRHKRAG